MTADRSRIMRAVKSRDTAPELLVRRMIHRLGYRYRLHRKDLPGKPDLAFIKARKVVFVHGCFWHGHTCDRGRRVPKTNTAYWLKKISRNRVRDSNSVKALRKMGWKTLILWECKLKKPEQLAAQIAKFLDS
ncbi:DNA mismatch endonuclease Vsr [Afipia massiliensis]|uniref:Very short patch repair endonuclease n=1 Tax=Afipia massiliensis TaxID=211460 RepID=A0A4U6BQ55_9BRAD|nr:DNA mismatch endonuclease Vsr [Afipia massiliensis]TKT70874.1 DNA mismatch endonuclease Vsr [Afipia massiliensis]